jgi:hypothetical protein
VTQESILLSFVVVFDLKILAGMPFQLLEVPTISLSRINTSEKKHLMNNHRPEYSSLFTMMIRPSANTISTSTRLSTLRPYKQLRNPIPPVSMMADPTG